ncbi:LCP family protein [cf. Phormidesmis sp. LEGE 11477]|uniref:LCP family protein n=1 Tax=cf. Phormidesmis sp. LEGE 11477 TaxID=1828680 RepID=UPI00187DFB3B|nr:LCP family protein [cf. Phormidesmis sp. LEGE 11477]MBE9064204.1 LCP family protein [cf. Phormidesmis sp. LEGE 11477]
MPKKQFRLPRWVGISVLLGGVTSFSMVAGALLAISLETTPLQQSDLSAEEAAIFTSDDPIATGSNLRLPRLTRPVNILLLGIKVTSSDLNDYDAIYEDGYDALVNSFEGLSDTMLLLRFDPSNESVSVLSVPRDTRTNVNGAVTKINEANRQGGPALSAQSVSELLGGVSIDRYVRINVQGVEKLIDAIGGVEVNVPKDMKYQDDSQHLYINLKAGKQRLDGDQALQFLRFRYDDNGDIGRVQRQQLFMRSLAQQALNPTTIARLPKILSVIQSNVDTNLSVEELVALVGYGAQTDRANVQMLMLPGSFSSYDDYDLSYWIPNYSEIDVLADQYFGLSNTYSISEQIDPSYLRIAIQDGTYDDVAVQSLADNLYDTGYMNVAIARSLRSPLSTTKIVAQRGDVASARAIQQFLGVGEVWVESTGDLNSDITIQLGEDWLSEHGEAL